MKIDYTLPFIGNIFLLMIQKKKKKNQVEIGKKRTGE